MAPMAAMSTAATMPMVRRFLFMSGLFLSVCWVYGLAGEVDATGQEHCGCVAGSCGRLAAVLGEFHEITPDTRRVLVVVQVAVPTGVALLVQAARGPSVEVRGAVAGPAGEMKIGEGGEAVGQAAVGDGRIPHWHQHVLAQEGVQLRVGTRLWCVA